jgi:hypothetical protein
VQKVSLIRKSGCTLPLEADLVSKVCVFLCMCTCQENEQVHPDKLMPSVFVLGYVKDSVCDYASMDIDHIS